MILLRKEDLKGLKMSSDQSRFDILAEVCSVALDKFNQSKKQRQDQQIPQPAKASKLKQTIKIVRKGKSENYSLSHRHDQEEEEEAKDEHKRSRYEDEDDWEINVEPKKKQKSTSAKPKRRAVRNRIPEPIVVPYLPETARRRIEEMGGTEVVLVIQKQLTESDLSSNQNRLLMSFSKIQEWGFLREEEKAKLRAQEIMAVPVIEPEPSVEVTEMNFRQWDMHKKFGGKTSSSYVLRTAWHDLAQRNGLLKDEVVQVWSFRVHGSLHMALVVVGRRPGPAAAVQLHSGHGGAGSSGSTEALQQLN